MRAARIIAGDWGWGGGGKARRRVEKPSDVMERISDDSVAHNNLAA